MYNKSILGKGDYIYEHGQVGGTHVRDHEGPAVLSLADYRHRPALYKGDPSLRDALAAHPFFLTWDDHEVANDYSGTDGSAPFVKRRAAAYQAWYEHQPVRLPAPTSPDWRIHRTVEHSDLLRFFVLDGRQYRSPYPGGVSQGLEDPRRFDEDRTMLGADQEAWLEGSLAEGGVTWNLLGNPVVLAGVDGGTDQAAYYLDTWDGFPQARTRLIEQLADHTLLNTSPLLDYIILA